MNEIRMYDFLEYLNNLIQDRKILKTVEIRKDIYNIYLWSIVEHKKQYTKTLAEFLAFVSHKKRIGTTRIKNYINILGGLSNE